MNLFGTLGGFDLILTRLQQQEEEGESVQPELITRKMDVNVMSILVNAVATPY
jgi:ubiquitin carboxyl-terminal hydrolase 34